MRIDISQLASGHTVKLTETFDNNDAAALVGGAIAEPLRVDVQARLLDGSVVAVELHVVGKTYARCDMCGTECVADCKGDWSEDIDLADSEFWDEETDSLVLDELVRQTVALSAPRQALCKPDCKGLCPVCGRNLNTGSCGCKPSDTAVDRSNPFAALQDIFSTGGAKNGSTKM